MQKRQIKTLQKSYFNNNKISTYLFLEDLGEHQRSFLLDCEFAEGLIILQRTQFLLYEHTLLSIFLNDLEKRKENVQKSLRLNSSFFNLAEKWAQNKVS